MPTSAPRARRRTTLALLVAGPLAVGSTAVSGCDLAVPGSRPEDTPEPTGTAGTGDSELSDTEVDTALSEQATAAIRGAALLVSATSTRHPALAGALTSLTQMHAAHLELLEGSADTSRTEAPSVRSRSGRALRRVRRHENELQVLLTTLAVQARSGALARVLASMAAAIGQHVLALPRPGQGGDQ